jgi:hypothetical protein
MARNSKMYRKLSGSGFSLMLTRSLWQGPDHLLWVEGSLAQELYKRFYFADIQALVLRRTHRRTLWAIVWGAFFLLFGAIAQFGSGTNYASIVMAALFLVILVVHWLLGPGCEVFLQTAVQMEKLTTLVRERKAVKVMNRIKVAAEQAQGGLSELTISAARASTFKMGDSHTLAGGKADGHLASTSHGTGTYDSRLHWALFGCLLIAGLLRIARFRIEAVPLLAADIFGLACTLVLSIIVLVRWHSHVKGTMLSLSGWLSMIFAALHGMFVYGVFMAASMQHPEMAYNTWALLRAFFELMMEEIPVIRGLNLGIGIASIALGALVALAILNHGGGRRVLTASHPEPAVTPDSGESA